MNINNYTCPCCGAPLAFASGSGKLECASCGNSFDPESIDALNGPQENKISFDIPRETSIGDGMSGFTCANCGAALMTDATTTATECPYCGRPSVLPSRIENGVKPEYVLPFRVSKEEATNAFNNYFKGKKLMPNVFLNGKNRITDMRKLYVPYWLFDCDAEADMVFDATKERTERQGEWEIKTIEHFLVQRSGSMSFDCVPVDGSVKFDDRISESLEPYDYSASVPFQPAVLSGALADNADVDADACEARAIQRVETSAEHAIRNTISGYSKLVVRRSYIHADNGRVTPVLAPVWLITTDKQEKDGKKTYTFAINGQTGKLTTDVKPDARKSFTWGAGVFAAVMVLAVVVLYLLKALASGTLLLTAIGALIVALITVSVLRGQLKTASRQTSAANYIREGSFHLYVKRDHFLYRNVERKKIQTQSPAQDKK